jgi:hypothetical protein
MRLLVNVPLLRRLPARLIGVGVRPERMRPELRAAAAGCAGSAPCRAPLAPVRSPAFSGARPTIVNDD